MSDRQTRAYNAAVASRSRLKMEITVLKAELARVQADITAGTTDGYSVTDATRPFYTEDR